MVTVKLHVLTFPLASVAVLVTVVVPTGNAVPLGGTLVKLTDPQLSLAVTLKTTLLEHWPSGTEPTKPGGQLITGGWVSFTVTLKLHVTIKFTASIAVQVTVVVPTGNAEPEGGLQKTTMLPVPPMTTDAE